LQQKTLQNRNLKAYFLGNSMNRSSEYASRIDRAIAGHTHGGRVFCPSDAERHPEIAVPELTTGPISGMI